MPRAFLYQDREHAGVKLANVLLSKHYENPFVLGLPRGGVVLARIVARILEAPLDVVISRKIGAADHSEFGIGAVSEDDEPFFTPGLSGLYLSHSSEVTETVKKEKEELARRVNMYRGGQSLPQMDSHTVIVVDDGLATGVTAIAAGKFLRTLRPLKLVLAVPLGPTDYPRELHQYYDEIVCPVYLDNMMSVGLWYREFPQVEDEEVLFSLSRLKKRAGDQFPTRSFK